MVDEDGIKIPTHGDHACDHVDGACASPESNLTAEARLRAPRACETGRSRCPTNSDVLVCCRGDRRRQAWSHGRAAGETPVDADESRGLVECYAVARHSYR